MVVKAEILTPVLCQIRFQDRNCSLEKDLGIWFTPQAVSSAGRRTNGEHDQILYDL